MATIGRYELVEEIGRGGMARVYRGHDPRIDRDVAVKVMSGEVLADPILRARFEREAQTIARLEHPSIVPIYDFGEDRDRLFIVMRLMGGGTLTDRLKNGPIPLGEAIKILGRIGSGLERAHQEGIIHRDLKPSNIMFDDYGEAYLADFGIARLTASATTLTGEAAIGTPAYMSPEQIHGDRDLDHRSDIYALGVVCFEMLTGKRPYADKTAAKLMMRHIIDPIPNIRQVKHDLPEGVENVITRTMAKSPDERFSTASELVDTLAMVARGAEVSRPRPPAERESAVTQADKEATEVMQPVFPTPPPTTPARPGERPAASVAPIAAAEPEKEPTKERRWLPLALGGGLLGLILIGAIAAGAFFLLGGDDNDDDEATDEVPVAEVTAGSERPEDERPGPTNTPRPLEPDGNQEEVDALLEQVLALRDAGELDEALPLVDQAIALQPDQGYLHNEKAGILRDMGLLADALDPANAAVELEPDVPDFLALRGAVFRDLGRLDEAVADHEAAVSLDPEYAFPHLELGLTYRDIGDKDLALRELSQAIELEPQTAYFFGYRAEVFRETGQYDEAIRDLNRAISLDDGDPWYFEQLGDMHLWDLGDPVKAIEYYNRILELDPATAWVYTSRAVANRWQGRLGPAIEDHNRAIELDGENPWFYLERAVTFRQGGEYESAIADLERAIALDHEDGNLYHERGATYFWNLNDFEAAEADLMRAIELEPENHSPMHTLALIYRDSERTEQAIEYFNRAAELAPWESWIFIDRGYMQRDGLDNVDAALADFNQAIEADPENPFAYQALATTLAWHMDDLQGGLEQAIRCTEVDPTEAWCYHELGWIHDALGNRDEAVEAFELYLEFSDPGDCPECVEEVRAFIGQEAAAPEPAEVPTMNLVAHQTCGNTIQADSGKNLRISYGTWGAANLELVQQNAQHLSVSLLLDGIPQRWQRQSPVPVPNLPGCDGGPRNSGDPNYYAIYFVSNIGPLAPGTYRLVVIYNLDAEVTDGIDSNGDGAPDNYGPGEIGRQEYNLVVN